LVGECVCDQRSSRELELAALVVERLSVSALVFRDGYYRAWEALLKIAHEAPAPIAQESATASGWPLTQDG
jgi:hypothetical protein